MQATAKAPVAPAATPQARLPSLRRSLVQTVTVRGARETGSETTYLWSRRVSGFDHSFGSRADFRNLRLFAGVVGAAAFVEVHGKTYPPKRRQAFCVRFSHDCGTVVFDGTLTDMQIGCDILAGYSDKYEFQYLMLARRERRDIQGGLCLPRNDSLQLLQFAGHLLMLFQSCLQPCQRRTEPVHGTPLRCGFAFIRPLARSSMAFEVHDLKWPRTGFRATFGHEGWLSTGRRHVIPETKPRTRPVRSINSHRPQQFPHIRRSKPRSSAELPLCG